MTIRLWISKRALLAGAFLAAYVLGGSFAQAAAPNEVASSIERVRAQLDQLAFAEREIRIEEFRAVEREFLALSSEGVMLPSDWRMMIHLALRTWNFERVQAYRREFAMAARLLAEVGLPPDVDGNATAAAPFWTLDPEGRALRRSDRRIDKGLHFLVVFHPGCTVCKRLIRDVEQDAEMQNFLRHCGTWVGVVEGNFSLEVFGRWAALHPTQSMVFVRDWSLIGLQPMFETPTMFLVQDGAIKGRLVGYPQGEAGKARIVAFLQSQGLGMERGCGR